MSSGSRAPLAGTFEAKCGQTNHGQTNIEVRVGTLAPHGIILYHLASQHRSWITSISQKILLVSIIFPCYVFQTKMRQCRQTTDKRRQTNIKISKSQKPHTAFISSCMHNILYSYLYHHASGSPRFRKDSSSPLACNVFLFLSMVGCRSV